MSPVHEQSKAELADSFERELAPKPLQRVVETFKRQHARGVFPGGQLAVWKRGVLVIDEAVGVARGFRRGQPGTDDETLRLFTRETRSCVFSAGKPLVAVAIALLEDGRHLDVGQPVARFWPGFAQAGKAEITVLDVLTHRSGLYVPEVERDWRHFGNWDLICERIERAAPAFARGTFAYQPMGFGRILGEVVRRVTGSTIDRFLEEEIFRPAGIERRSETGSA